MQTHVSLAEVLDPRAPHDPIGDSVMWSSLLDCAYTDDSCERARLKLLRLVADGEIGRDTAVAQMQAVIDRLSEHADEAALELVRQQVASASSAGRRR